MSPQLALALTIFFVVFLFKKGFDPDYKPSLALWVPTIWFMILMSRPVTLWLNLSSSSVVTSQSAEDLLDGTPIDRFVFMALIVCGVVILWSRHLAWAKIVSHNAFLVLFLVYCGISIIWSDFLFTAFKRWT